MVYCKNYNDNDCKKVAAYGYDYKKALSCSLHKKEDMVNVISKRCEHEDCRKMPTFALPGEKAKTCKEHSLLGYINVKDRKCIAKGCLKRPCYGLEGQIALFCLEHKSDEHIDVVHPKCIVCETVRASFGKEKSKPLYCSNHVPEDCKDVVHRRCEVDLCEIQPSFGVEGGRPVRCVKHALENHVNVVTPKCTYPGCKITPSYGLPDGIADRCSKHPKEGYINIKSKRCEFDDCKKIPVFGEPGKSATRCKEHKLDGYVDIGNKNKICKFEGCITRATYGDPEEGTATRCSQHALLGYKNVMEKNCTYPDCDKRSYYGFPGESVSVCREHISPGYIKHPKRKCVECKEGIALFSFDKNDPTHCEDCKLPEQENLSLRECVNCHKLEICDEKSVCFEYCIQSDIFTKHKHSKELLIKRILEENINLPLFSHDKIIDSSIDIYRPDFVYKLQNHAVVLEVDENAHRSYDPECYTKRMQSIAQSIKLPCYFIRYNPDSYKQDNKTLNPSLLKRKEELLKILNFCIETPTETLQTIKLYYDDCPHLFEHLDEY